MTTFEDISKQTLLSREVWVVFTNQTELPLLSALKDGFRHCFILIHDGEHWISVDPMSNYMEVVVHNVPAHFDLAAWLKARGHHMIKTQIKDNLTKPAPMMPFTCVEACKRILGIHGRFIFTPWQLYKHIVLEQKRQNIACRKSDAPEYEIEGDLLWEV